MKKFANVASVAEFFIKQSEKFTNVTEPTNMAEFLQMWQNLQCFQMLQILQGP